MKFPKDFTRVWLTKKAVNKAKKKALQGEKLWATISRAIDKL